MLLTNDAGGAIFSTGSMRWMSAAAFADGYNAVSWVTLNVCCRFLSGLLVDQARPHRA